jgi:hypothetical protein
MASDETRRRLELVDADRIRHDLFYLSKDPLPFRKLNYTVPGHGKCTLYEADDYIGGQLAKAGWDVDTEAVQVQAFRCDTSKPKAHQYSRPAPEDPWYAAYNVWGRKRGAQHPDEVILLCAHKDSQSWVDSPGAHDNATGTAGLMELARALSDYQPARSIRLLFCNEEHTPWTSVAAAEGCRDRGDKLIAVLNCDGFGARSEEQAEADEKSNGIRYTLDGGKWLTDLMVEINERYGIGLTQYVSKRDRPSTRTIIAKTTSRSTWTSRACRNSPRSRSPPSCNLTPKARRPYSQPLIALIVALPSGALSPPKGRRRVARPPQCRRVGRNRILCGPPQVYPPEAGLHASGGQALGAGGKGRRGTGPIAPCATSRPPGCRPEPAAGRAKDLYLATAATQAIAGCAPVTGAKALRDRIAAGSISPNVQ